MAKSMSRFFVCIITKGTNMNLRRYENNKLIGEANFNDFRDFTNTEIKEAIEQYRKTGSSE